MTREMRAAYVRTAPAGAAHTSRPGRERLVGGIYGVGSAGVFFGETMFSAIRASKVALAAWCGAAAGWPLIDARWRTRTCEPGQPAASRGQFVARSPAGRPAARVAR